MEYYKAMKLLNSLLTVICTVAGTWSVLDKHWFLVVLYYAAAVFFYNRVEREVFKD